nr:hypothetical protein Iba_chr07aCG5620 [Ipomoea batatas]GMD33266.1 hypothetical protein Iba_scaffold1244796CG0010 [Ipomoea batatas]
MPTLRKFSSPPLTSPSMNLTLIRANGVERMLKDRSSLLRGLLNLGSNSL